MTLAYAKTETNGVNENKLITNSLEEI